MPKPRHVGGSIGAFVAGKECPKEQEHSDATTKLLLLRNTQKQCCGTMGDFINTAQHECYATHSVCTVRW